MYAGGRKTVGTDQRNTVQVQELAFNSYAGKVGQGIVDEPDCLLTLRNLMFLFTSNKYFEGDKEGVVHAPAA